MLSYLKMQLLTCAFLALSASIVPLKECYNYNNLGGFYLEDGNRKQWMALNVQIAVAICFIRTCYIHRKI